MTAIVPLLLLALLLIPSPGVADERAKMLWSRGLIELQADHYPEALALFEQSLEVDPQDVYARYYRAVARARLGDREGAIADLHAVLAAEPDFDEAALDLGATLIEEQKYREALPWLEQARNSPTLSARASLFIGIAQLRDEQLEAAKESLAHAVDDPEYGLTARYYAAVVDYQLGNRAAARETFAGVAAAQPESAIGREARRFIELLDSPEERWYSLYAGAGFNYDSNVILAPAVGGGAAESVLGVSQKDDGEATIRAGALLIPWRNESSGFSIAYDFFQSYHFELVEFDLQNHAATAQVGSAYGIFRFGLLGRYDYSLLDTQSFVQAATASPWATARTGDFGRFAVFYRMLWSDYKQISFSVRNSFNHAVGATQYVEIGSPDRVLSLGYQFDFEDPNVDQSMVDAGHYTADQAERFGYDGNEVNVGAAWLLPWSVDAETRFAYRHERYRKESAAFTPSGKRRQDNDFLFSLVLRRPIWKEIDAIVGYFGDFNDSKDPDFNYDRSVVSIGVEARY